MEPTRARLWVETPEPGGSVRRTFLGPFPILGDFTERDPDNPPPPGRLVVVYEYSIRGRALDVRVVVTEEFLRDGFNVVSAMRQSADEAAAALALEE